MCGRYTLTTSHQALSTLFGVTASAVDILQRYNIAPTQTVPIVRNDPEDGRRTLLSARWGLIPAWRKNPMEGPLLVNARAESAADTASFRDAYRRRRCIVPASGFYEWKSAPGGKIPHFIRRRDGDPIAMAGLFEEWRGEEGAPAISCTVLTVPACEPVSLLHHRMPAMIDTMDFDLWLNPTTPIAIIGELLAKPSPSLESWPVSRRVNRVDNDDPQCIEREEPAQGSLF